jgi:competence protein ComGD
MKNLKSLHFEAFTMFEAMLTLAITVMVIGIFSLTFQKAVHVVRGELFVLEFENILKNQQVQAVTTSEAKSLSASNGVVTVNGEVLQTPEETSFSDFSITFNPNGNLQSISDAKIVITLPWEADKQITYQLQLGSGQYKKTTSQGLYSVRKFNHHEFVSSFNISAFRGDFKQSKGNC